MKSLHYGTQIASYGGQNGGYGTLNASYGGQNGGSELVICNNWR